MTEFKQIGSLVQPMFDGTVDVIGDIHGEIEAIETLLQHLGYERNGRHPENRRLVFLGDLVDRGPDSIAVLDLVMPMIATGRAQCVLGNHELNILRGKVEPYNYWFHGDVPDKPESPQAVLPLERRDEVMEFFHSLPLALERSDLRAVHACWDDAAVDAVRAASSALEHFEQTQRSLKTRIEQEKITDKAERNLILQNENPIKVITSGPERRAVTPFVAGGKLRQEARHPWWNDYEAKAMCICGHYWRVPVPGKCSDTLFEGSDPHAPLGKGKVMCIDYSVGGRFMERRSGQSFGARLAALRWPEGQLWSDISGSVQTVHCDTTSPPVLRS